MNSSEVTPSKHGPSDAKNGDMLGEMYADAKSPGGSVGAKDDYSHK